MNISFDATAILGPLSKNRGIGNYALSQFGKMIERDRNNHYFFLNFYEDFRLSDIIGTAENLHEFYFYTGEENSLLKNPQYTSLIGDIIQNFIREHQIDIFYMTSPFESTSFIYQKEWFSQVKVVATVYDIIPYVMKEHYLSNATVYQAYMSRIEMLRWVDRCLVISNSVKEDLVEQLQFDPEKIDVIYGAADERYCQLDVPDEVKEAILRKYALDSTYILCIGGDDARKNLDGLILAYSMLPAQLIAQYQLVIVCKLEEHSFKRYTELIQTKQMIGRVVLTHFVPNRELLLLNSLAHLLVFPSKYEGFGLPVVEAWACGTPVLTSNNSSLGEIAGEAAVLVDPFSVEDITRGLTEALTEVDLSELRAKGLERLKLFQWDEVADLTISYLEKEYALQSKPAAKELTMNRKTKLAFFTPLPPMKSGISDYSVDILNAISDFFEIDVLIDDGYQADHILNRSIRILNHREFLKKKYDHVLYQVGNSDYHTYMLPYIEKYGGIVVLHDYNLHSIAYSISTRKKSSLSLYREYLLEDYPASFVNEYLQNLKSGASGVRTFEVELNGFITNYADKIIVHSEEAKAKLLQRDISRSIQKIHHYAKIEALADPAAAKAAMGISKDQVIFSSFGYIQRTKRTMPALKAFHRLYKQYRNIHYYFVGSPDSITRDEMYEYIRKNQLEDCVTITGYIDLNDFTRYIDATDVCVNLRYPSNGETSGSLMRILAKGKCVMVNEIGSFQEIPDDCCVKIPSVETMTERQEVERIYREFERLLSDRSQIEHYCANARKYAELYLDLNQIAKQYTAFILESHKSSLTEDTLSKLLKEITARSYTNFQIEQLGRTLSYGKNYEPRVKEEVSFRADA